VDPVLVPVGGSLGRQRGELLTAVLQVGQARRLDQPVGDVHPETGHPAVEPESQHRLELGPHRRVGPVKVGLVDVEQVQIPLARLPVRFGDPGPPRPAEDRTPARVPKRGSTSR